MSFGDLKVQDLIYEDSSNNEITVVIADLATKSNPTFVGTINGADLILSGNLTVSGTQTIINTNVLQVEDKHIEIGKVSTPSDTTADGGGIILKASSDRTFLWVNATDAWTSSEHIQVASGKTFIGDGSTLTALNASNLGSGTVPTARLGSGTASSSNFLRGDGSWQTVTTTTINNNADNRIITGSGTANTLEGEANFVFNASNTRVGIGVATPDRALHLKNPAQIQLESTDTGNWLGITYKGSSGTNNYLAYSGILDSNGSFFVDVGSNGNDLTITQAGAATFSGSVTATSFSGSGANLTNLPPGGNSVDLVADGAIAAGKPVIIKSNGKAEQVQETIIPANPPVCGDTSGSRLYFSNDIKSKITSDYAANVTGYTATGLTFNCWRENDNHIRGRFTKYTNDNSHDSGFSTTTITSSGNAYGDPLCRYVGDGYWLIVWATGNSSSNPVKCRTIRYNGDLGVENNLMSQGNASGRYFDAVRISDTRTVVTWRQNGNGSIWAHDSSAARVIDWSNSGTSRTLSGGSDATTGIGNHGAGQLASLAYDSTNSKVVLVCPSAGTSIKIVAGTVSGSAGSGSISWGTALTFASGSDLGSNATVTYDSTNNKLAVIYRRDSDGKIAGAVITIASNNTVTAYTKAFNTVTQTTDGNSTAVSSRGLFVRAYINNLAARIAGGTISGTTFTWQGNSREVSNSDSASPQINYISAKDRFEVFREKTNGEELYSSQTTASSSSNNVTSKNVIGFAPLAISDGNTGTIHCDGNTVDNQSSLTAGTSYWVQNNGTLGTSVATTLAGGIALSSTKLLIKQYAVA